MMIEKTYEDIYDLCERASDVFQEVIKDNRLSSEAKRNISIIVPRTYVQNTLLWFTDLLYDFGEIHYKSPMDYDGEYVLTLSLYDGVWCEPMISDNEFLEVNDFATYILDSCNSSVVHGVKSDLVIVANLLEEDLCDDCEECQSVLDEYIEKL